MARNIRANVLSGLVVALALIPDAIAFFIPSQDLPACFAKLPVVPILELR
jgi:MFS superfamily sulfate permease-like transporter